MKPATRIPLIALFALVLTQPGTAAAHARATSFSYWTEDADRIEGRLVFPWAEVEQAFPQWRGRRPGDLLADPAAAGAMLAFFSAAVSLTDAAGNPCATSHWTGPTGKESALQFTAGARCPGGLSAIDFSLTFDAAPSHVHLVRFERAGEVLTGTVTSGSREWNVAVQPGGAPSGLTGFVKTGFEHILAGPDHLLFLVALLLLAPSLGFLAALATGFTLSHSLSLAVAVYGLAKPHGPSIEALIAFTVAFSALEVFLSLLPHGDAGRRAGRRLRLGASLVFLSLVVLAFEGILVVRPWALTGVALFAVSFLYLAGEGVGWKWLMVFLFGFVHGFGFAGPLLEMSLSRSQTAEALLGFNLGVEGGQLLFLGALWPVIRWAGKGERRIPLSGALAALVLAAGIGWFFTRAWNG